MKRIFSIFLSFCFVISSMLFLSSCKNKTSPTLISFQMGYMSDLMIDVEHVTAYGIRQNFDSDSETRVVKISFVANVVNNNQRDEKPKRNYYLYSTTETYEYGNVEYNENSISKVTFKKNTSISKDVYDKDGNLITAETKIEQNDIDAQINKIYTTKQYTFMQFVACVESSGNYNYKDSNNQIKSEYVTLRPDSLTYDENGVADFDKTDYFSENLTASFVIDNSTGYIYKIENFHIKSFKNGLVVDNNGYYYRLTVDANNNLVFTDIMPNKDVIINNAVLDNYGWVFVQNNYIQSIDDINKIIYVINDSYCYDRDLNVYKFENYSGAMMSFISKSIINGIEQDFSSNTLIQDIIQLQTNRNDMSFIGYYKENQIYNFTIYTQQGRLGVKNNLSINENGAFITWYDSNYDFIFAIKDDKLYFKNIDLNQTYGSINLNEDFTKISEDSFFRVEDKYYITIGNDKYCQINVFSKIGLYGTEYYKLIKNDNQLELIKLDSIIYEDNIFIFQPINKN